MADTYGRNLGTKYGAEEAPSIVTRSLNSTEIAVTEICVHRPPGRLSDPIPRADAYMISLILGDLPNNAYWEEGVRFWHTLCGPTKSPFTTSGANHAQ
jgi:AraC family transcriptional regulator